MLLTTRHSVNCHIASGCGNDITQCGESEKCIISFWLKSGNRTLRCLGDDPWHRRRNEGSSFRQRKITRSAERATCERQMVGKYPAYNKCTVISTASATRNKKNLMLHRVFARTDLNHASDSHISSYLVSHKR
jgi:hypothetical protein